MTKNIIVAILISVGLIAGSIVIAPEVNIDAATVTATGAPYTKQIVTSYWPGGNKMEGPVATSRPGLDGKSLPRTLEDFAAGRSSYVSVAADPAWYGAKFLQKEYSFRDTTGKVQTLQNVVFYVHDTGGAFMVSKVDEYNKNYNPNPPTNLQEAIAASNRRLRKFDVAYGIVGPETGSSLDGNQPPKSNEWIPINEKAANPPLATYNGKYGIATVGGDAIRDGSSGADLSGQNFETREGSGDYQNNNTAQGAPCPPKPQSTPTSGGQPPVSGTGGASPLQNPIFTSYWPVKGGGTQSMEGGWETSRKGLHGQSTPSTLEMVRTGESNFVTIAADPSHYGETYVIPKISYVNNQGQQHTLYNVKAYVHDTGGAFIVRDGDSAATKDRKLRKFDIAYDSSSSDAEAARLDGKQPSKKDVQFIPADGTVVNTTSEPSGNDDPCWCKTDPKEYEACKNQTQDRVTVVPNYGGAPLWQTSPNCFKHMGNPSGPTVYYMTFTCNAGIKIDGRNTRYVSDCGVNNSVGCNETLSKLTGTAGCLWAVCKGNNAIWDPGTRRCGCDDGKPSTYTFGTEEERVENEFDQRHQYVDPRCQQDKKDWGASRPVSKSSLDDIYGDFNNYKNEIEPNLVTINFLGRNVLVHKYAAQSFAEMDREIKATHPNEYKIKSVGTYDHRTMNTRQGALDKPSQHAYGIAFDINAGDMPVKTVTQSTNTVPSWFVDIASKHGFKWGGNFSSSYYDPMHFQYTRGKEYYDANGGQLPSWLTYKDSAGKTHNGGAVAVETPLGLDKEAKEIPDCRDDQNIIYNDTTGKCECIDVPGQPFTSEEGFAGGKQPYWSGSGVSPKGGPNAQKIYESAKSAVGNLSTCSIPGTDGGNMGCAAAVSEILKDVGVTGVSSQLTTTMHQKIESSGKFSLVANVSDAMPGDIIISPSTWVGGKKITGHVGIVMTPGGSTIASNSSGDGMFKENFTMSRWRTRYETKKGLDTYIWRAR